MEEPERRRCPACNHEIPVANWDLHQAQCSRRRATGRGANSNNNPQISRGRRQYMSDQCFWILVVCSLFLLQYILLLLSWLTSPFWGGGGTPGEFVSEELLFESYRSQGIAGLVRAGLERKAYLSITSQSYPLEPWPESNFDWNVVGKDDFWKVLPFAWQHLKHVPQDQIFHLDFQPGSAEHRAKARQARETFLNFAQAVQSFKWTAEAPSRGVCQQQVDGTICAVYRWNAWHDHSSNGEEQQKGLLGRLQCWTDPSLTKSDPSFIQQHPQFHRYLHQSSGCMCIADLPGFYIQVGAPEGIPAILVNDITMRIESSYDFEVEIEVNDGPNEVVNSLQTYLFKFLEWFEDPIDDEAQTNNDNDDNIDETVLPANDDIEAALPGDNEL